MNEIFEYLFNNYMQLNAKNLILDKDTLVLDLQQQGYNNKEINKALSWLAGLLTQQQNSKKQQESTNAIRVFSNAECIFLDTKSRGLLVQLDQSNSLDPKTREHVISQLINLHKNKNKKEHVKWFLSMMSILDKEQQNADDQ